MSLTTSDVFRGQRLYFEDVPPRRDIWTVNHKLSEANPMAVDRTPNLLLRKSSLNNLVSRELDVLSAKYILPRPGCSPLKSYTNF